MFTRFSTVAFFFFIPLESMQLGKTAKIINLSNTNCVIKHELCHFTLSLN